MRFGYKKKILSIILAFLLVASILYINVYVGAILLIVLIITLVFILIKYCKTVITHLVKKTNWWSNLFTFTYQFADSSDKVNGVQQKIEIVNVGSNPARFAFFYENILGENWSTGTQSLDRDFDILKNYHSCLIDGATVILPIVPFSSVTGYLHINNYDKIEYKLKFLKILDSLQTNTSYYSQAKDCLKNPLLYDKSAWKYIFNDVEKDKRIEIVANPLQLVDMEKDALRWMKCWKDEFHIDSFEAPLTNELQKGRDWSVKKMGEMIGFLQKRGYRPVIVSPPVSKSLAKHFSPKVKEIYIDSFIREIKNNYDIEYLDYFTSEKFQNSEYYFNALFMNLKGRKAFTKQLLSDLNLNKTI